MLVVFASTDVWAQPSGPVELSDSDLEQYRAGEQMEFDFENQIVRFTSGNIATEVGIGIGGDAFSAAQGVITTLQAVNSVVDLNVYVNIYLDGAGSLF